MFNSKTNDFLKFTYICLGYTTLNFIIQFMLINCSEYNLTNNCLIKNLFPKFFENSSIIADGNTETFTFDDLEKLNIQKSYLGRMQQNYQSDFSNENNILDGQGRFINTHLPLSQDLLNCEPSKFSVDLPEDLSTFLSKYDSTDCTINVENLDDGIVIKDIDTLVDLKPSGSSCQLNITPIEYIQTISNETKTIQQTEPVSVLYNSEKENINNSNQETKVNLFDIPITPCSSNYSLNSLIPEAHNDLKIIDKDIKVITTSKNGSNAYVEQTINNQSKKNMSDNKHIIKQPGKLSKTITFVSNDSNCILMNPNINMNSCFKNKHIISHVAEDLNKEDKFTNHLSKTLKRKTEENMRRAKIPKLIINAIEPTFPIDLKELELNTEYNLNIRIFINSKNTQRDFEKTFVFKMEENTTFKTKKNELCQRITYTISFIPKFFITEFHESETILFFNEHHNPKVHEFYYTMRRTINIQSFEDLQKIHLVPYLIPNEDCFCGEKYVKVIKHWYYRFFKIDDEGKTKLLTTNSKGENVSKRIRGFLDALPSIIKGKKIQNPILIKILRKISDLNYHLEHIRLHHCTTEVFQNGCKDICEFRKQFFATGGIEPPLYGLNAIEIELGAVYHKIYYYYMMFSKSILDCYNNFLREDNEDMLTYY